MISDTLFTRVFAKPSAWRVLAVLMQPPFVPRQQREFTEALAIPPSTFQRAVAALQLAELVVKRRRQYVLNLAQDASRYLWLARQVERQMTLPSEVRNALTSTVASSVPPEATVVLFGSWAHGIGVPLESDIDIAIFGADVQGDSRRVFSGSFSVELHHFARPELREPRSSAALDALMSGIPLVRREDVFEAVVELRFFPTAFLLYRLEQARSFLDRAAILSSVRDVAAREFFEDLANRAVGQVRSILEHGRTASWRETPREASIDSAIVELRQVLAREGDRIWLT